MIVPIFDRLGLIANATRRPACSRCPMMACYGELAETYDAQGLCTAEQIERFYCSTHAPGGNRLDLSNVRDCIDRPCGPDFCEFPACRKKDDA